MVFGWAENNGKKKPSATDCHDAKDRLEAETCHDVAALVHPGETGDGARDNKGYSWGTSSSRNQYWECHWKVHNRGAFALLGAFKYGPSATATG